MKTHFQFFFFIISLLYVWQAPAQDDREDVVYLKNGSIYRGVLIEQRPGISYKIEIAGGSVISVQAADVDKITKENKVHMADTPSPNTVNTGESYNRSEETYGRRSKRSFEYRENGYFFQGQLYGGLFEGGIRVINGYKVNQYASVGMGIGIEGIGGTVGINQNSNYSGTYMPIFAYYTGDILKRKITPFYQASAGYAFWISNGDGEDGGYESPSYSAEGGFMGSAGIGCRFYTRRRFYTAISLNVDVKNPTLFTTTTYYDNNNNPYNVTVKTSSWLAIPLLMFSLGF
jgi:hypothetical protein